MLFWYTYLVWGSFKLWTPNLRIICTYRIYNYKTIFRQKYIVNVDIGLIKNIGFILQDKENFFELTCI